MASTFLTTAATCIGGVACAASAEVYTEDVMACLTGGGASTALVQDICGNKLVECDAIGPGGAYASRLECIWGGMALRETDPAAYASWEACLLASVGCAYEGCGPLPGT